MELSTMLEYQKLDMALMRLENEVRQSQATKLYVSNKAVLTNAQEAVIKQNRDAGEMIQQMQALIAEYESVEKELKEAEDAVSDIEDAEAAEFYFRNVQKLINRLKNLSSEISKTSGKIVELNQNHAAMMNAGKEAKKKHLVYKEAYEAERDKYMPQATALQQQIAEAEKNCSEEFLTVYKRIRKLKKIPVIVPLVDGHSCGGCFMEVAGDALVALGSKPFVECPSCGRILYKD